MHIKGHDNDNSSYKDYDYGRNIAGDDFFVNA